MNIQAISPALHFNCSPCQRLGVKGCALFLLLIVQIKLLTSVTLSSYLSANHFQMLLMVSSNVRNVLTWDLTLERDFTQIIFPSSIGNSEQDVSKHQLMLPLIITISNKHNKF